MIVRMKPFYCSKCEKFLRKRDVNERWQLIARCKVCGQFAYKTTTYLESVVLRDGQRREELLRKLKVEEE